MIAVKSGVFVKKAPLFYGVFRRGKNLPALLVEEKTSGATIKSGELYASRKINIRNGLKIYLK